MKITDHFWSEEFDCKDGTPYPEEWIESRLRPLCEALERVRQKCGGTALSITSGFRTASWNLAVGGAKESRHLLGDAADFIIWRAEAGDVWQAVLDLQETGVVPCGGAALYRQKVPFVHMDTRGRRVRWDGSTSQVPL